MRFLARFDSGRRPQAIPKRDKLRDRWASRCVRRPEASTLLKSQRPVDSKDVMNASYASSASGQGQSPPSPGRQLVEVGGISGARSAAHSNPPGEVTDG
ncbi:MAG: hypothetical protein JWQ92_1333 [Amnibacterium sp.]|nr:hypothetical protein [Amnibacterium sp.]